ncbi:MAG: 3',5'-cyclic-nucleotide phosphodiesterase [Pyrinomonadaceae bacterium]|nr:3',5'-cyclic-nucleotide phosphodiesterase [Pyrinomonadaceae bacterium]
MKIELLPSTIENGRAVNRQHLSCFVLDDKIAIDAGCLPLGASRVQIQNIRDVVLTHAHIDHIAGLPLFIDDLFSELKSPVKVHSAEEVNAVLQKHIFNWEVYPDFSELENENGPVLEYVDFEPGASFAIGDFSIRGIPVNHKVPSYGFVVEKEKKTLALTGDTAEMNGFWSEVNGCETLEALLVECAFPNELSELAEVSHHLTPNRLAAELDRFEVDCPVLAINLKPAYRDDTERQIKDLGIENLSVMEIGTPYRF